MRSKHNSSFSLRHRSQFVVWSDSVYGVIILPSKHTKGPICVLLLGFLNLPVGSLTWFYQCIYIRMEELTVFLQHILCVATKNQSLRLCSLWYLMILCCLWTKTQGWRKTCNFQIHHSHPQFIAVLFYAKIVATSSLQLKIEISKIYPQYI